MNSSLNSEFAKFRQQYAFVILLKECLQHVFFVLSPLGDRDVKPSNLITFSFMGSEDWIL